PDETLAQDLKTAWHRFVDVTAPLRRDLFAYCRRLTDNLWDAEDLAQDTLMRAFSQLGVTYPEVDNPKAYLLRIASNVWIDRQRRESRRGELEALVAADPMHEPDRTALRDAGRTLAERLPPRERAAIVLKDLFGMTNSEVAHLLATTEGAVKSALHRARDRLRSVEPPRVRKVPPKDGTTARFLELFEARDFDGLVNLFSDGATAENVGNSFHLGRESERGFRAVLHACVFGHPEWPEEYQRETLRLEPIECEGETALLAIQSRSGQESLASIFRLDLEGGKISRFRSYGFCRDAIAEVADLVGLPSRTGIYRAPTPAPGADWPDEG
ncbi:MAG: sigma-70 family RNA polymerase sigma factor, partial [Gammaproteobacteria bacterium]